MPVKPSNPDADVSPPFSLSPQAIECLLSSQQTLSDRYPWCSNDESTIDHYLKGLCAQIMRVTRTMSRIEWKHYGSGYASFVDAWFYQTTPQFNVRRPPRDGEAHTGLVVLLNRRAPYFVFMEGEKHWLARSASSYLPEFAMIDRLNTPAVLSLSQQVQLLLESGGLIRLSRQQLERPLPPDLHVPTLLTDRGFTYFDALFHWED
ncbi:hypothetical protein FJU30_08890 [Affinibrenneria salicis]|uniref:Uncharacterized protein n=1 Tax=Affinibrenneria salicis TaxID=2590031 RepID=A0A5J5G3L6_9GAMM|nr:hypothetical protein [Affinibrenneria salicis]KAA9001322.1 hypothetical protein FJU30_08890 [Affinibrenneria salicis]